MAATYATAVAFGKFHTWICGRCINNRGRVQVIQLGGQLWRCDMKLRTTVTQLESDGWHRAKSQKWTRS